MTSHPSGVQGGRDGDHVPTSRIRHKKAALEARLGREIGLLIIPTDKAA